MRASTQSLKTDLRKSIEDLHKLRDEIRGELRVAGADARKQWKRFFEPQLSNAEAFVKELGDASHAAVTRTAAAFGEFRASLKNPAAPPRRRPRAKKIAH